MIISLEQADFLALIVLVVATAPCIYRVLYGPTLADRIAAEDALGNALVVIFALYAFEASFNFPDGRSHASCNHFLRRDCYSGKIP